MAKRSVLPAKGAVAGLTTDIDFDAQDFVDALLRYPTEAEVAPFIETALLAAGDAVRSNVVQKASRHRRRGRLERGVRVTTQGKGFLMAVKVHSGGPTAHLIAGGVRRHEIRPNPHRIMQFPKGGVQGFGYVVQSPGFPADPYFRHGVEASVPEVNQILKETAQAMVADLAVRLRGTP